MAAATKLLAKDKSKREKQYLIEDIVQSKTPKYVKITNATNNKQTNQKNPNTFRTDIIKHELVEMKVNQSTFSFFFFFEIDNMVTEIKTIGQI